MNYTSKNTTASQNINRLTAIGLPIRNIFTSLISFFLLSFFGGGVKAQTIGTPTVTGTPVCVGSTITLSFLVTNGNGNSSYFQSLTTNYTAYLSNSSGSFASPTLIVF